MVALSRRLFAQAGSSTCRDAVVSSQIHLRFDATYAGCATSLPARSYATWDRATKAVTCLACDAAPALAGQELVRPVEEVADVGVTDPAVQRPATSAMPDRGVAGGSARRIADRQQAKRNRAKQARDQATREAHPRIGTLLVKAQDLMAEPERPTSWQQGATGEEAVGRRFDRLFGDGFAVLHDRRKRGSRWNIDHIVVGPRGAYVVDAKHYSGRLEVRSPGTFLRPAPKRVFVKGRSQDKRVEAMDWQVDWVSSAAGELIASYGGIIRPVLCFVGVDVALTQRPTLVGLSDVLVTWPERFVKDISRDGPLTHGQVCEVANRIATALPAAVS